MNILAGFDVLSKGSSPGVMAFKPTMMESPHDSVVVFSN